MNSNPLGAPPRDGGMRQAEYGKDSTKNNKKLTTKKNEKTNFDAPPGRGGSDDGECHNHLRLCRQL